MRTGSRNRAEGDASGRVKTDGLNEAAWRLNDFDVRMRPTEFETHVG
jgi:hypothetical protein